MLSSTRAQLQEQTKIAKEQVEALMQDRRVKDEELETRRQRDEAKIHTYLLLGYFCLFLKLCL
jgi:coiled-coil domain-containing protein 77